MAKLLNIVDIVALVEYLLSENLPDNINICNLDINGSSQENLDDCTDELDTNCCCNLNLCIDSVDVCDITLLVEMILE